MEGQKKRWNFRKEPCVDWTSGLLPGEGVRAWFHWHQLVFGHISLRLGDRVGWAYLLSGGEVLAGSSGVEVKECCPGISQYCQSLSDFKRPPEVATGERALWVVLDPGQYGYLMRGSLHWEPATRTESSAQHSVMTSMAGMGAGQQGGPRERGYMCTKSWFSSLNSGN